MGIYHILLLIHIAAGTVCLISGAIAFSVRKKRRRHTLPGEIYHAAYVFIFATAVIMAWMKWSQIAFLFYIALFSYGLALMGYLARKKRWRNWISYHISGMLGSYIGVITAVLVVNGDRIPLMNQLPHLWLWFLPTIIGSPIIAMAGNRFKLKRRTV